MEATVLGTFLTGPAANFEDTGSFLPDTGVVGALGILSHKSLGSLMAGLTMGHFVLFEDLSAGA